MLMTILIPDIVTPEVRILDGFHLEWVLDTGTSNTTGAVILRTLQRELPVVSPQRD